VGSTFLEFLIEELEEAKDDWIDDEDWDD
ncbi:SMI1/KNR4 family protein, partial [Pseudomonas sp. GW456-E7]